MRQTISETYSKALDLKELEVLIKVTQAVRAEKQEKKRGD